MKHTQMADLDRTNSVAMGKVSKTEARGLSKTRTEKLETEECPHYCSVGGHYWSHPVKRDAQNRSLCEWRMNDRENQGPVVKYFSVCLLHRRF